jgi:hypothetical protein
MSDPAGREVDHKYHLDSKMAWQQQNLRWETENAFLNHEILYRMRLAGRARCLSEAPPHQGPAIVVGSGSSLDKVIDHLYKWKGSIICSTSHGATLVKHGAPPTYMSCLDPRKAPEDEMAVPPGGWDRTHYLAHLSTPRGYFDEWFSRTNQLTYLFRIMEPTYDWYVKHLPWAYPWVRAKFLPFIDSSASNISLAARLGFDPIFTIGMDYGGPRFKQAEWMGTEWKESLPSGAISYGGGMWKKEDGKLVTRDGFVPGLKDPTGGRFDVLLGPGGIETDPGMMYSKRGMLISIFMQIMKDSNPIRVYQMSNPSNCNEFPYVDWQEVLDNQGDYPKWSPELRASVAETMEISLAQSDTFMIPVEGGFGTDYRVYMVGQDMLYRALSDLNLELLDNKTDLMKKEKEMGMKIPEMIEKKLIQVEHGELVVHEAEDLKNWSVEKMSGLNIEAIAQHIRDVYDKSKELPRLVKAT